MLRALRDEANALAKMPCHRDWRTWSVNANAGTVRSMPGGELIAYLHPAALAGALHIGWLLPGGGGDRT